jgi:hypothetical protein
MVGNPATRRTRFMAKITATSDGHWRWDGARSPQDYGFFDGTTAHRVAWKLFRGEVPEGMEVHHLCLTRWCVNPEHLALLTISENRLESWTRPRPNMGANAKTHCKHGHPLVEGNLYWRERYGRRERQCRTCTREAAAASYERRRQRGLGAWH